MQEAFCRIPRPMCTTRLEGTPVSMPEPITSSNASPQTLLPINSSQMPLIHVPTTGNLCSLDSTHLADPGRRRLDLPNSTDLVASVAGNADVVATFKGELNIANLQDLGATFLRILACRLQNLVDKLISNGKDGLCSC